MPLTCPFGRESLSIGAPLSGWFRSLGSDGLVPAGSVGEGELEEPFRLLEVSGLTLPVVAEVAVVVAFASVFLTLAVRSLGRPD